MTDSACPMCGSTRSIKIIEHDSSFLAQFYEDLYKVDVTRFLPEPVVGTYRCTDCDLKVHRPALPGDSNFYDEMQKFPFYYEESKPEFTYAVNQVLKMNPASILEMGCGSGKFLKKISTAFNVKGSEHSQKSIEILQQTGISLDTPSDTYDFICSFQVLEHVEDVNGFLTTATEKLHDGGHLLVTVPNNDSKYYQERFGILDYPPHHLTQWSRKALYSIADIFGLTVVEYYEEPLRIEHYQALIKSRRKSISKGKIKTLVAKIAGIILDGVITPYMIDMVNYPGHTHGILLRKDQ